MVFFFVELFFLRVQPNHKLRSEEKNEHEYPSPRNVKIATTV